MGRAVNCNIIFLPLLINRTQARNSIKSGRAKAIFIAPDFEDSEALDEKLDVCIV